jgi:hypothetical protein
MPDPYLLSSYLSSLLSLARAWQRYCCGSSRRFNVADERKSASPVARVQRVGGLRLLVGNAGERSENLLASVKRGDVVSLITRHGDNVAPI